MNPNEIRNTLQQLLGSVSEPVAVTFRDAAPSGIQRVASAAPAGCSYWRLAAEGGVFYTVGEDHMNCPIGAYTHGVELSTDSESQLQATIEKMVGIQYLKMEEIPAIPRRAKPLRFVVYAPLAKAEETPDVVLLRGNARQVMLLVEAASALNIMSTFPAMGRPACAVIAATMESGKATTSLGCIGNRVYTGLLDYEFYVTVPGQFLAEMVEALGSIVAANSELEQYHRTRCASA